MRKGSPHPKDVREVLLQPVGHLRLLGDLQRQVGVPQAVNLHPQEGLQVGNRQHPRRGQAYPRGENPHPRQGDPRDRDLSMGKNIQEQGDLNTAGNRLYANLLQKACLLRLKVTICPGKFWMGSTIGVNPLGDLAEGFVDCATNMLQLQLQITIKVD